MKRAILGTLALAAFCSPAFGQCAKPIEVCRTEAADQENKAPECSSGNVTQFKTAIENAIKLAPSLVRDDLCRIEKFYVTGGNSFGFWENPFSGEDARRRSYIGVNDKTFSQTLAEEETELMKQLLQQAPGDKFNLKFEIVPDKPENNNALAVLAVLAHELAHIKWYRQNVFADACYREHFEGKSWDKVDDAFARKWVKFNEEKGTLKDKNTKRPKEVKDKAHTRELINNYRRGFASPFATVSPEEDYVETFKLATLWPNFTAKQGNSRQGGRDFSVFTVSIDSDHSTGKDGIDLRDFKSDVLAAKLACVWPQIGTVPAESGARRPGPTRR